jgi:hypothetical protein
MTMRRVLLVALCTVLSAGCGRSSLIGFDDGCSAGGVCRSADGSIGDGFRDGSVDGSHDGSVDGFHDGSVDGFHDGSVDGAIDGSIDGGKDGGLDGGKDGGCVPTTEICNNGKDEDCNGLIDCMDPSCFGNRACITPGQEICNNGIDDDDDGLIDCADPDCMNNPVCMPHMGQEICNNGKDDNGDGLVDCADPQCVTFPACLTVDCKSDVDFGTIQPHDSKVTKTLDTTGATQSFATCATPGGTARVGSFSVAAAADVRLDFTQVPGAAHVISVFRAGVNQACDQNPVFCVNAGQNATATHTFPALPAGNYWVVVQSYPGTQGSTTVTLSTSPSTKHEICNNGVDDDGNGLIDCADLACKNDPACINSQCNPDINLGTLIVDGPSKQATAVTSTSSNRYHPTCAGTSTGKDFAVSFTLPEAAGILVQWQQSGDHVISLFFFPPPGQNCDAQQNSCFYPSGNSGGAVAFSNRPAGKYVLIVKAISPGKEGVVSMQISAFKNRMVEICNNGIDDDGNGLIDCADPACAGVGTCQAPLCMPDQDLGALGPGDVKTTVLNTSTGHTGYKATCAKGNGKADVVRITLTQPMALGFQCTESGSHVLQLSEQVQPLDTCDAHDFNCADPNVLPFGCNFAMPNLQPGKYNVIVEAFQSGSEGTVNLTLFGLAEKVLEICNNGIDDDGDGAVDCNDLKCVTSPLCTQFQCRADQKMGVVPLDGSTTSVVVQTTNAGDDQTMTSCVSAAGGQDAVIDFSTPAKSNLQLDWAQVGNHVFALYQDTSDLLACEAGPLVSCTPSMAASTGTIQYPALPQGKYHLVVDADHPGSEGGVVVQLSGQVAP